MTAQTRVTNKSRYEQGDKPQGSDYADLIDSFLSLADTTAQTSTSDFIAPKLIATTEVSAPLVVATEVSASTVQTKTLHATTVSGATVNANTLNAGTINVSSSAIFQERIQVGDGGQRGTVTLVQRVTLAANITAGVPAVIVLPSGSDVVDFIVDVEIPFATGAGVTAADVNISAAGGLRMAVINVSASTTRYNLAGAQSVNGSTFRNVTATIEAHVSIQGSPTAMTAGQAMLTVLYIPA